MIFLWPSPKFVQIKWIHLKLWLPWQPKGKSLKLFFSKTTKPRAQIFGVQHCLVVPYHICSNHAPGVQIGPAPGIPCFTQTYKGKSLKIIFSETMRPRAKIFGVQHCVVVLYQVCSNHAPRVKIGPAPGVACFTQTYIGKSLKIFFAETIRPRAKIFGLQHCVLVLYQVCSNHAPRIKIGPAPRGCLFNTDLHREIFKNLLL